ncbi:Protein disulfide isomerase-like 5-3 [Acorus calamus]|uniref:Protein disulfide isomerase-like 5-3 n=1 Tax=Acorus calamus TaxID=4465 RepID=A0AAV9E349_ACOCL|nr:Protein disulfide isomerase-like 5-3 [Acorus calamus]
MNDVSDEKSLKLIRTLKSAASANRDLLFSYVGVKQWEEFADTFDDDRRFIDHYTAFSNKKNPGKVPRKIHKAEREKLKHDHLNELFVELGNALEAYEKKDSEHLWR